MRITSLIQKYNVPGPRYTSYPTVPYWESQHFSVELWQQTLKRAFDESITVKGLAYIFIYRFVKVYVRFAVAINA